MRVFLYASLAAAATAQSSHPHLAQAWQAQSSGDGLPNTVGLESYIYEDCNPPTDTCMNGHVFNYGADTCIKYEVNRGYGSPYTGVYYVKCDAVDCCVGGTPPQAPDLKQWDIGQGSKLKSDNITYLGKIATTELNDNPVTADAWSEIFSLPFTKVKINYTYYITTEGNDTITHRIDYSEPGDPSAQNGAILFGDFKVQHDLDSFRDVFKAPPECLKPNTVKCGDKQVAEWEKKYFRPGSLKKHN